MLPDEDGFLRPVIDEAKCVGCGKCEAVCPCVHEKNAVLPKMCFVSRSKDEEILNESSSGGLFSELALRVLNRGGCVFGCALRNCIAELVKVEDAQGLAELRGSKYVQSDVKNTYCECRAELEKGRPVLFSGVPCQIAGLKAFLGHDYDNLLTVGVICHGVTSPAVLARYVEDEEQACGSTVKTIRFRDKLKSRGTISMVLSFDGRRERVYKNSFATNAYMRSFLGCYSYRDICFRCKFRSGRSGADILLGDFWGVEKVSNRFDVYKGASAVLLYTEKAEKIFETCDVERQSVRYEEVARENRNLDENPLRPSGADAFMREFRSCKSVKALMDKLAPESWSVKLERFIVMQERSIKNLLGLNR